MTSSYNMTNTSHQPHVWTREDVAKNYQVSVRTVGEWIAYRRIPTIRIGRTVRFRPDAVARALEKFEVKAVMN